MSTGFAINSPTSEVQLISKRRGRRSFPLFSYLASRPNARPTTMTDRGVYDERRDAVW